MPRFAYASIGLAVLVTAAAVQPGLAQDHHGRSGGGHHFGGGRAGGVHRAWAGGNWHHGWHNGRVGWWWVVPGWDWYSYDAPLYPYPDPYQPPGVAAAGPGAYWYYCANPPGYYPYVPQCSMPWQPVVPQQNPG